MPFKVFIHGIKLAKPQRITKEEFMKKNVCRLGALIISTMFFALNAQAADESTKLLAQPRPVQDSSEWRPHIALFIGSAYPEGSGIVAAEFGIDVGYQPYIPFGLSAEFTHAQIDDGTEMKERNTLWAKGTYNFGGDTVVIKDSYVGLGLGTVFKTDGISVAAAPLIGFDIPIDLTNSEHFSLGASSRYAIVSDREVDTLSLAGVIKYWY
jgi:hypothetical protein